jgi:hypothetical protein
MTEDMGAHLRITELAEKLAGLDSREGEHFGALTGQLGQLAESVGTAGTELDRQGEILAALDGVDQQVVELAGIVAALAEEPADEDGEGDGTRKPYRPAPPVRWWEVHGEDREAAVDRLQAWVRDVYVPGYGHLAAALPACWAEHPLCLYSLDVLSELWMVLYLTPRRSPGSLAGQAEWQTRILPLYVSQMAAEANGCDHGSQARRSVR